jgi:hypothetical protein
VTMECSSMSTMDQPNSSCRQSITELGVVATEV